MLKNKKLTALLLLPFLLSSCATSSITNLTPTQQPRNPTGLYPIEFAWDSSQVTLRPDTIAPQVVIGFDFHPMRPTLKMNNRWEALVPIPPNQNSIIYHVKVDYEYNQIGKKGKGSKLSPEYKLTIVDR